MDNLIYLEHDKPIKFGTLPIWIDYVFYNDGRVQKKHFATIILKDINLDIHVIHPLTQFIFDNWKSREFNTQRKHANNIVKFLNYLLLNKKNLSVNTLRDLNFSHGTQYLNSLSSEGVNRTTVKGAERTLTSFYYWLTKHHVLNHISQDLFTKKEAQFFSYYESPFHPLYPNEKPKEIEHILPNEYIPLFLEIATLVAKPIALGIYFQIFGGLRISEVVNLKRTQVSRRMQTGDFTLKLAKQNFRPDLKEDASVKKVRTQRVMQISDWGQILFKDHIRLFIPLDQSDALFVNRDKKALSQRSYRQYFQKIKDTFIKTLEEHGDNEQKLLAQHLKCQKWSTHIGRGTFTNMIAEDAENPYEIAHLRGDSDITSSLTYMVSTERIHKKIEEKMSHMHQHYIPRLIKEED
ncbi:tyrosine-type recombinase/integrase [Priestia megaterium]|uniref:tyrosine-type recombinase/integrase n=1 Tax=Priestia megaterium TaxID=1404 RepID=UPI002D7F6A2C|nr:hypothetical protein [Priestia megaterium]MEB4859535.1 hypothetical protein [Priestia megaterium]